MKSATFKEVSGFYYNPDKPSEFRLVEWGYTGYREINYPAVHCRDESYSCLREIPLEVAERLEALYKAGGYLLPKKELPEFDSKEECEAFLLENQRDLDQYQITLSREDVGSLDEDTWNHRPCWVSYYDSPWGKIYLY